jgi:preprotein translocase subunit SecA
MATLDRKPRVLPPDLLSETSETSETAVIAAIDAFEPELRTASEDGLRARAGELRLHADARAPLDELLPEVFALVREAGVRVLGERLYSVQIAAGLALHRGQVAEMATGEGKTLAAVAPVALHALAGKGVHVLTFNDYLARRDAAWMGPIYQQLGLSVGCVQEGMTPAERRQAYTCDVTYLTAKEAGFDLLRDGLALALEGQVHRPFHLALIDEVDSILIDEARIPLVIAGRIDEPESDLARLAAIARRFARGRDFQVDEGNHNVFLTDPGIERAEALLGCGSLFVPRNVRLQAELRNALHAESLLRRDVDYIVRDGRIELVDELTGRVAENRVWPDGLQAALEAKEGILRQPEGTILSSITLQHFLHKYPRLCGMTATARPAAVELAEVYHLEVAAIPTFRPSIRADEPDRIFATRAAKRRAVIDEIVRVHAPGRPILVGTASVEDSEDLARELAAAGVPCRVLNARNDAEEAEIIAEAGAPGAVTISTNMAGRGTDIKLGGSRERERERVLALGGLYVLGMQRHASRRIDDQLRGRAGRQGDPGSSRFFLSLEDDVPRRCQVDRLVPRTALGEPELDDLGLPRLRREIEHAQRVIEGEHGDIRMRLFRYARVIEVQRAAIQEWRQEVLEERLAEIHVSMLARRSAARWTSLCEAYGEPLLRAIERRLTLFTIDRTWSDHLAALAALRDEVPLVRLDGRDPLVEFHRRADTAFDRLSDDIDEEVAALFDRIQITAQGVDWEAEGVRGPSSTWTYLVQDNAYNSSPFLTMATRASLGLWAVLAAWPLLLVWGLAAHWKRWRDRKRPPATGEERD